jgi:plasmid maintenance system antidote protein VapI
MTDQNISKSEMAKRLKTSRSQLDRLLDPENESITLQTASRAAAVLGMTLEINLHPM